MSILLIGQKSLPQSEQYYFSKEQRTAAIRVNRIKKERYRTQLLQQIEENKQRKLRQKQIERTLQKQREIAVLRELYKKHQNRQTHIKQWYGHKSFFDRPFYDYRSYLEGKRNSQNLPHIYYPYHYFYPNSQEQDYQISYCKPQKSQLKPNYHKPRKIKTQNADYISQPQYLSKSQIIQNPQERIKQLKKYQNHKFKEVYQLLDQSINALHEEATKKRSSRLKKLNYKLKNKQTINNISQQERQFYELPSWSIKKPIKQAKQEDKEWQSWFAKQKLKELHQSSENQHLRSQIKDRLLGLHKRIKSKIEQ